LPATGTIVRKDRSLVAVDHASFVALMIGDTAVALLLVLAALTTEAVNVNNSVVFVGNKNARGSACQSWW
jgi:hypothetical protein